MAKKTRETNTLVQLLEWFLKGPDANKFLVGMVLALLLVIYLQGK